MEAAISARTIFGGCCISCCSSSATSHYTDKKKNNKGISHNIDSYACANTPTVWSYVGEHLCIQLAKASGLRSDIYRNYTDVTKFFFFFFIYIMPIYNLLHKGSNK